MEKNDHNALLKEFGHKLGLDLSFNENRICELYFDNRLDIIIRSEDDDGVIIISTVLAESLPEHISYSVLFDILDNSAEAYIKGGNVPIIGRDEDTGLIILYIVCTASYLKKKKFIDIFTEFLEYHENIYNVLLENNN